MRVSWSKCKRYLSSLWFTGSGVLFFVLLLQTMLGNKYEGTSEQWEWFLPTIMPTLSLIISILVADSLGQGVKKRTVNGYFFRLSFSLSLGYLVVVALTIFVHPFTMFEPLELMKQSNLWLAPIQGLVTASLGVFFIRSESQ